MSENKQKKTVLIVGGSFGGLTAVKTLGNKFNIILVDRKSFFEFTPSFPYALTDINYIDSISADIQKFADKGTLTDLNSNSAVIKKDENDTQTIIFDYCIISTGSNYSSFIKPTGDALSIEQRKDQIKSIVEKLEKGQKILVVGGGAVGVEIAGIAKDHFKQLQVDLWTNSSELLSQFPEKARKIAKDSLTKLGVSIEFNKEVTVFPQIEYDYIFDCRGNVYSPNFMNGQEFKQYIETKGRIIVDEYNRLENHQHIYCIGDACINSNNEPKMSYNAMIQGEYAADNIIKTERTSNSLNRLNGSANLYCISTSRKKAIMCVGQCLVFESCINYYQKMQVEAIVCRSFQGSTFYSALSYLQRKFVILITKMNSCCQSRKKKDQQKQQKVTPSSKYQVVEA